jgi:hypothetical protein
MAKQVGYRGGYKPFKDAVKLLTERGVFKLPGHNTTSRTLREDKRLEMNLDKLPTGKLKAVAFERIGTTDKFRLYMEDTEGCYSDTLRLTGMPETVRKGIFNWFEIKPLIRSLSLAKKLNKLEITWEISSAVDN